MLMMRWADAIVRSAKDASDDCFLARPLRQPPRMVLGTRDFRLSLLPVMLLMLVTAWKGPWLGRTGFNLDLVVRSLSFRMMLMLKTPMRSEMHLGNATVDRILLVGGLA